MEGVRFVEAEAAKAAFVLGEVVYRCAWCGRVHRAGEGRECLRSYARACRCWRKVGPLPPIPHLSPAFYFAVGVWLKHRPALPGDDEVLPGEWVLALEPTAAGLRGALEEELEARWQAAKEAVDAHWRFHEAWQAWVRRLASARPPARVARRAWSSGCKGCISWFELEPAVPPPWKVSVLAVDAEMLFLCCREWLGCPNEWKQPRLLRVEYGAEAFLAVFGEPPSFAQLLVCREVYGMAPEFRLERHRGGGSQAVPEQVGRNR